MDLYIVRHGQSYVNREQWSTLTTMDTALTELGQRQAVALRDWLQEKEVKADALYASTMRRANETADFIAPAFGLTPVLDDRLREIGNNYANGLPVPEAKLPRTFNDKWPNHAPYAPRTFEFEGAESWVHFQVRVAQFIDDIVEKHSADETVYVVAHGGVIAATFDVLFNVGGFRVCGVHADNTSWTHFKHYGNGSRERWILYEHNRVDHLLAEGLVS